MPLDDDEVHEERYETLVSFRNARINVFKKHLVKHIKRLIDEFVKKNDDLFYMP